MGQILIEGIKIYARHGCMNEEAMIGANYRVDVSIETDFSAAAQKDELSETVDYCVVCDIVKEQMTIRSRLIENAASRILAALKTQFPRCNQIQVKLTKLAPPVKGETEQVSVIISA